MKQFMNIILEICYIVLDPELRLRIKLLKYTFRLILNIHLQLDARDSEIFPSSLDQLIYIFNDLITK